jgi:hypothetical protein
MKVSYSFEFVFKKANSHQTGNELTYCFIFQIKESALHHPKEFLLKSAL